MAVTPAAITSSGYSNLVDLAKAMGANDEIGEPIALLAESNPILQDANVMESNMVNGHISIWESSLSSGTWRTYNSGVAISKGTTKQVTDTCGSLEKLSDVDAALADESGNAAKFRRVLDNMQVSGLNNDAAEAIFLANAKTDPEKMHGLGPRYNSLTAGDYYSYVKNGAGSGSDNTSIWFVTWGPMTCSLIYPKGSRGGLQIIDKGQQRVLDGSSNAFYVYETQFIWKLGLAVVDPRYVSRLCNIDVSDLTGDAATGADLLDLMIDTYALRPTGSLSETMARTFIYCNKTIWKFLWKQSSNKANVQLQQGTAGGSPFVMWNGIPVHVCDAIGVAEATVS